MSKQMKDTAKPQGVFHQSSYNDSFNNHINNSQYSLLSNTAESLKSENNQKYDNIINLQRTAGNQAVQRLIKSERLQPKLKVSPHSDRYEQDADMVANRITKNDKFSAISSNSDSDDGSNFAVSRKNVDSSSIDNLTYINSTLINSALNTPGKNLDNNTLHYMEPRLGYNFKDVRIHNDSSASKSADSINAKAYTVGNDMVFGKGQYNPSTDTGKNLIAHELTHVMQQNSNPSNRGIQMKSKLATANTSTRLEGEANKKADNISADKSSKKNKSKEEIPLFSEKSFDLQGLKTLKSLPVLADLESNKTKNKRSAVKLNAHFGKIASGQLELHRSHKGFNGVGNLTLNQHPLFPDPFPASLVIKISDDKVSGNIKFTTPEEQIFSLLGITPLANKKKIKLTNSLQEGNLSFGVDFPIALGNVIDGRGTLVITGDSFDAKMVVPIKLKGLGSGEVEFKYEKGVITGKGKASVILKEGKYKGDLHFDFNGESLSAEGKIGYNSDKFSGEVLLQLMDVNEAKSLQEGKQEASVGVGSSPTSSTKDSSLASNTENKTKKINKYVIAGQGNLNFAFTDWLTGNAQVVVNPQGDVKVIGKITPSKEYILFPQRKQPFRKDLAKFKAQAGYGFPVIGNVGVFADIDVFLWALPGPGLLRDIQIESEYSTDPKERQSYSLSAALNISAAAGITLRAAGGLKTTILAHDIKVGVGVNGTLGIKGYANAPVVIGYREEGGENEDKKGAYFIKGELEVAAQPFLSLAGDLFIELDSPWLSPLPDKTWSWPLGDMEWPLGGSFGLKAAVEHVIGSKQIPEIEFQEIDFSGDKFMTDIIDQKTAPSAKRAAETAGQWKEKNVKNSPPPPAQAATPKGGLKEGTVPQKGVSGPGSAVAPIKPTKPEEQSSKKQKKKEKMNEDIAKEGSDIKSKDTHLEKLHGDNKQIEKDLEKHDPNKGKGKKGTDKQDTRNIEKQEERKDMSHEKKWEVGVKAVKKALEYAKKEGISKKELDRILKKIEDRKVFGFSKLHAPESSDNEKKWKVYGSMSDPKEIEEIEFVTQEQTKRFDQLIIYLEQNGVEVKHNILKELAKTNDKRSLGIKLNEIISIKEKIVYLAKLKEIRGISLDNINTFLESEIDPNELTVRSKITGKQPPEFDRGNFMHRYARRLVPGLQRFPNALHEQEIDQRPEVSKYRVDFLDLGSRTVIELKPEHLRNEGETQVNKYVDALDRNERERGGQLFWQGEVLGYRTTTALRLLAEWLREENPQLSQTESIARASLIANEYNL